MRFDTFTTQFQQAFADAQSLAVGNDNPYIEPQHLLSALVAQQDGGTSSLLAHAGVNVGGLRSALKTLSGKAKLTEANMREGLALVQQSLLEADVSYDVAKDFAPNAPHSVHSVGDIPADGMILDIGPKSLADFAERIKSAKTLLWNGPVGAFETPPFGEGTFALAKIAAERTRAGQLVSVAGGGDTVAALNKAGVTDQFTYVSTAGGAFLEWLEGRELPGVIALAQSRTPAQ